jgi:hypothetical protein
MRCNQAVISAFMAHPEYRQYVSSGYLMETGGVEAARYAPPDAARSIVNLLADKLVSQQTKTGLWKHPSRGRKQHAVPLSYRTLAAIGKAGMLAEVGSVALPLRYDPFPPFAESNDRFGLLVRKLYGRALAEDASLARSLMRDIAARQESNGSWHDTVTGTALALESLLELGAQPDAPALIRGSEWLLGQYRESISQRGFVIPSLFCSAHSAAELDNAVQEIPEAIPVFACYGLLPLIPTGLALRTLLTAGFVGDPRVEAAYASLLKLAVLDPDSGGVTKGWCSHSCIQQLQDRAKATRTRS